MVAPPNVPQEERDGEKAVWPLSREKEKFQEPKGRTKQTFLQCQSSAVYPLEQELS